MDLTSDFATQKWSACWDERKEHSEMYFSLIKKPLFQINFFFNQKWHQNEESWF